MSKIMARFKKNPQSQTQDNLSIIEDNSGGLKRSNAKSQRHSRCIVVFDATNSTVDLPGHPPGSVSDLILPVQEQPVKPESVAEEPVEEVEYETVRVPVPGSMYQFTEIRRPKKKKLKSRSGFLGFGGKKQKTPNQDPVAPPAAKKQPDADSVVSEMPAQPDEVADPYRDAMAAREDWVARNDDAIRRQINGKGKHPEISNVPEQQSGALEIPDYMRPTSLASRKEAVSPADSGIGLDGDDDQSLHTAQSRASLDELDAVEKSLVVAKDKMASILAEEAALIAEMEQEALDLQKWEQEERTRKERLEEEERNRKQRLEEEERNRRTRQAQQERERKRRQQEREDRRKALEMQKEQELERELQEEIDRIEAQRLQDEEIARVAAEEAERNRPRDCICCGDSKHPLTFPAKPATTSCEHESQTCKDCMQSWLSSEFDTKGTEDLKCPECPSTLSHSEIQLHSSPETFVSYEKVLTRNALSQLDEFAWCLSPTCDSGQLNIQESDDLGEYMDCASCGYKQCLRHKVPWHSNESCDAYEYRTSGKKAADEEKATEEMLDSVSKKCPGEGCGWRIQKIDGCDHMKCKKCKFEFCWECLASHKEIKRVGNTAHESWCRAVGWRSYHTLAWDNDTDMPV